MLVACNHRDSCPQVTRQNKYPSCHLYYIQKKTHLPRYLQSVNLNVSLVCGLTSTKVKLVEIKGE